MNTQQEGLGCCTKCGNPIMQTINQPGIKGICFGCYADGQPKTGRTVVVRSETGELKNAQALNLLGTATVEEVSHEVGASSNVIKNPDEIRKQIADKAQAKGVAPVTPAVGDVHVEPVQEGVVTINVTVDDLYKGDILVTLLHAIYDGIDNMPPFKTLKETKKAIKVQEDIEKQLAKLEPKESNG